MKLSIVLLLFLLVAIISPVTIRQARASAPPYGQSNYHPEYYLLPTPVFGPAALGGPAPPDVQVAAGSGPDQDYVIELVNSWYVIYPKNTGCPQGGCPVLPLSDIFKYDTSTNFISDPKIIYDTSSLRWYASILECIGSNSACTSTTNGCTILAVSPYKDPNVGHWYDYRLCYGVSIVPDQPLLGISNDKVIISSNFFNAASGAYVGAFWEVYNLNDVETNHFTTNSYNGYGPYSNVESVYPVHDLTYDGSGTAWMVSTYGRNTVSSLNCNTSPYVNKIAVFKITGVPPTSSSTSYLVSLKTGNYFRSPPNASQQGTTNLISTGDCRTQSAVFWNSKIWLAANDSCVPQGDTRSRSCFQVVQLDTTNPSAAPLQDFDVGYAGYYTFYPALRVDSNGNLDVVFGYSSQNDYPTIAVAGEGHDESGAMSPDLPINLSQFAPTYDRDYCDTNHVCRFGDYFGAGVDPTTPSRVWIAGEFITGNTGTWASFFTEMDIVHN